MTAEAQVRVVLYHRTDDAEALTAAYHATSTAMVGVPGLLGNELLRSLTEPAEYVVTSTWAGFAAFAAWEEGPEHKAQTEPLRPFRHPATSGAFACYTTMASYGPAPAGPVGAGRPSGASR